MDISTLIDYEFLYPLNLRHPVTDEPMGIKFQIRSAASPTAKKVQREHTDKNLERFAKRKSLTGAQVDEEALEKAASYIAAWDWGEHDYEGTKPELAMQTAIAILEKEDWMLGQVVEAAGKVANFSTASAKT